MSSIVDVRVLDVNPSGLIVEIIDSKRMGRIPRRELAWDRRWDFMPQFPKRGDGLQALYIRENGEGRLDDLSIKQLTDPWAQVGTRYEVGQVVDAEVVNVRDFGVFAQLEPGIDAIIHPEGLPLERDKLPASILQVGDKIQGKIVFLDGKTRRMEIDVLLRLKELDSRSERLQMQKTVFARLPPMPASSVGSAPSPEQVKIFHPGIGKLDLLLLVEDDPKERARIRDYLESELQVAIETCDTKAKAVVRMSHPPIPDLVIIDLQLDNDESGFELAEEIWETNQNMVFLFVSVAWQMQEKIKNIGASRPPFVLKDPEEIAEMIKQMRDGYWAPFSATSETAVRGASNFVEQLGMQAITRASLRDALENSLDVLQRRVRANHVVVLEVDSREQQVRILGIAPQPDPEVLKRSADGLFHSLVQTVVEENQPYAAARIDRDKDRQYRNFFPLLDFTSFYGVPISIAADKTRHALFVLGDDNLRLNNATQEIVQASAYVIGVALERAVVLEYMERYEDRYRRGNLLLNMVHEVLHKIDGLGGTVGSLAKQLGIERAAVSTEEMRKQREVTRDLVREIEEGFATIKELMESYSNMSHGKMESTDVNAIVEKVQRQLKLEAREAHVEIFSELTRQLPNSWGIPSRLEEIISNLVLNACQQISIQRERMKHLPRLGREEALLQRGVVVISTRYDKRSPQMPIQIRVMDSGPGIHRSLHERIFQLDKTTREGGRGLGLFISRNLAEAMGGRLRLFASVMFVGSEFVIELPAYEGERAN